MRTEPEGQEWIGVGIAIGAGAGAGFGVAIGIVIGAIYAQRSERKG